MIHYETTATFYFATSVRPELGIEREARKRMKAFIEQEGIDAFLDLMEFEDMREKKVSEEELDELIENGDLLIPMDALKETLTAISLGILEVEGISKETALEQLNNMNKKKESDE